MSAFVCSQCGCVENTATSNYWEQKYPFGGGESKPLLCSECDPETKRWHGCFDKKSAKGLVLASDGFLYSEEDVAGGVLKRMNIEVVKRIE